MVQKAINKHKRKSPIDLHSHSTFSILDGIGKPESVVDRAVELGWPAVSLTEHGWMGSAPILYKAAKAAGIKPILGCEFYIVPDDWLGVQNKDARTKSYHLTVLALSKEGYHNLVTWTTFANKRENYKPRISLGAMAEIAPYPLHHNVVLSGCLSSELLRFFLDTNGSPWPGAIAYVNMVKSLFSNFYLELQDHYIEKFAYQGYNEYDKLLDIETRTREFLLHLAGLTDTPLVITNDSHMQRTNQRRPHLAMKLATWKHHEGAMDKMSDLAIARELESYSYYGNYMRSMEEVAAALPSKVASKALDNITSIVAESNINLNPLDKFSYCVSPETKILTYDLDWVEAKELNVGDELWAFDEDLNGNKDTPAGLRARKWRKSIVEKVGKKKLPCYEIWLAHGNFKEKLIVSEDHLWIICKRDGFKATQAVWCSTKDLCIDERVPRYITPWVIENNWDGGWLAGILDGEGSINKRGNGISISQLPGDVMDQLVEILDDLSIPTRYYSHKEVDVIYISGGLKNRLELLGRVKSIRLINNLKSSLEGRRLQRSEIWTITAINKLSDTEVITLQTSTRTFFAEGFGAHNSVPFSGYKDPIARIRKRSKRRLRELEEIHGKVATKRFEHELDSMGDFAHYLLIVSDLVTNWNKQGIFTHTRGSAANSILCYALGIHNIDSIHYSLTFERFYNPSRKKLPDVDIDIDPDRYDDAIRFATEYMAEREGDGNIARICNYGTLANKAAFRLIAESQGISKEKVDEVTKLLPSMIDSGMANEEEEAFELIKEEYPDVYELTAGVFDSIKSVSQHACAWLLGTRDRPIREWVPLCLIASSNTEVTQYNYKILDKYFGLVKLDVLRLTTLSVIKKTLEMSDLASTEGITNKEEIPLDDEATFDMLCAGDTDGVHSMQGKTQRQGCIEVKPRNVFDLVAIQALYRPSGTRTGFDKVFVRRRRKEEKVPKIHPLVDSVLAETYGLPIYQEQVLDIGYALGFTHEEAQQLLDAIKMAKGVGRGASEAFDALWPVFWKRAKASGMDKEKAKEVWKLFDAFQGYGFNKGHATSYALLAYQCAYLKCHTKLPFDVSLLEKFPNKVRYISTARRDKFEFEYPDVSESSAGFSLGDFESGIRVGLSRIKGLGPVAVKEIVDNQPYSSFEDFRKRTQTSKVNKARIEVLEAVGALSNLGIATPDELVINRKIKGEMKKRVYKGADSIQFHLLGFTLDMPKAMQGLKPRHTVKHNTDSTWKHLGYQSGVELNEGPTSVSKMFWIPPLPKEDLYVKKASSWARIHTYLLTAVDENGIPFEIKANEDKKDKVEILEGIANRCRGGVVCLDGAIRAPFTFDSPLGFQLFNITGAWHDEPQIFIHSKDADMVKMAFVEATRRRGN
jgi:DNA polymerase III alpha subunit